MSISQRNKFILTGVIVIISLLILIWGFSYLRGRHIFSDDNTYYVIYENTNGLTKSAAVTMHGYKIGEVASITLDLTNKPQIEVALFIKEDVKLPLGTVAKIISSDIMGTKAVELIITDTTAFHKNDDFLKADAEESIKDMVNTQIIPLKNKIEILLQETQSAMQAVNAILDKSAEQNIKRMLVSFNSTLTHLNKLATVLDSATHNQGSNIGNIIGNINKISTDFKGISQTLSEAPLDKTLKNIDSTMKKIAVTFAKIDNGEGTVGQLIANDSLYNSLLQMSNSINQLTTDIKANPKKYINVKMFGKN